MVLITPIGPIWDSTEKSFSEIHSWLTREVDLARLQATQTDHDFYNVRFSRSIAAAADALLQILETAWHMEQDRRAAGTLLEQHDLKIQIDRIFEFVPVILSDMTSAYLQRKEKGIHQFFSSGISRPRQSLSELHLAYPVVMRGVESLAEWLHLALFSFWGNVKCEIPIVSIAGEKFAAFRPPLPFEVDIRSVLDQQLSCLLNATTIILPRWQPGQLRSLAVIGHEIFHKVLFIADYWDYCRRELSDFSKACPNPSVLEKWYDNLNDTFSDEIISLADIRSLLVEHIDDFFNDREIPSSPDGSTQDLSLRGTMSSLHATEILADIAAEVLCGPAYLYSMLDILHSPAEEELLLRTASRDRLMKHPPGYCRTMFLAEFLREIGFVNHADQFENAFGFAETWSNVARFHPYTRAYYELLTSKPILSLCRKCVDLLAHSMTTRGTRFKPHIAGKYGMPKEDEWRKLWTELVREVLNGNVLSFDLTDYVPPDVINAIWFRIFDERFGTVDPPRTAWRFALRNTSVETEG
jgi:hypothetical protein